MTKEELANALDSTGFTCDDISCTLNVPEELREQAIKSGLVFVCGPDYDTMEFDGAIRHRLDRCNGGMAYLDETGLLEKESGENCPCIAIRQAGVKTIYANWNDCKCLWTYETSIPHAKFNLFDEGELSCVGIVFDLSELKTPKPPAMRRWEADSEPPDGLYISEDEIVVRVKKGELHWCDTNIFESWETYTDTINNFLCRYVCEYIWGPIPEPEAK
jgi:hypothetical protein